MLLNCHSTNPYCQEELTRRSVGLGGAADLDDTLVLTSECDKVAFAAVRTHACLARPNARSGLTTRDWPLPERQRMLRFSSRDARGYLDKHAAHLTDVTVVVGLRCLTGRRARLQVCALAKQRQPTVDE